jgi:hypothetical protein
MPGLDPGIHVFDSPSKTWMAGASPAMTNPDGLAMRDPKKLDPIPPGEILAEEFMKPHGISQNRLTRDLDVNPARINDIVDG